MSYPIQPVPHVIDLGAPAWCWSRLGLAGEGIISYDGSRGRQSLVVPYLVTGQQITIALASFNDSGWLAAGHETQLEVSGATAENLRWVVRITGTAEREDPAGPTGPADSRRTQPANSLGHGAPAPSARLCLVTPRVRGFYETLLPTG